MAKLKRTDIVDEKGRWIAETNGRKVDSATKKAELVKRTAKEASASRGTSLRNHERNGQVQEERTYPRSKDPADSKG